VRNYPKNSTKETRKITSLRTSPGRLENFVIESDVFFSADFKQKLVDPNNHADAMASSDASAWKEAEIKEVNI
jgi:hypothetical protein